MDILCFYVYNYKAANKVLLSYDCITNTNLVTRLQTSSISNNCNQLILCQNFLMHDLKQEFIPQTKSALKTNVVEPSSYIYSRVSKAMSKQNSTIYPSRQKYKDNHPFSSVVCRRYPVPSLKKDTPGNVSIKHSVTYNRRQKRIFTIQKLK